MPFKITWKKSTQMSKHHCTPTVQTLSISIWMIYAWHENLFIQFCCLFLWKFTFNEFIYDNWCLKSCSLHAICVLDHLLLGSGLPLWQLYYLLFWNIMLLLIRGLWHMKWTPVETWSKSPLVSSNNIQTVTLHPSTAYNFLTEDLDAFDIHSITSLVT